MALRLGGGGRAPCVAPSRLRQCPTAFCCCYLLIGHFTKKKLQFALLFASFLRYIIAVSIYLLVYQNTFWGVSIYLTRKVIWYMCLIIFNKQYKKNAVKIQCWKFCRTVGKGPKLNVNAIVEFHFHLLSLQSEKYWNRIKLPSLALYDMS